MLTMDSVKLRLEREQPMSFIEFNYMILQAYDFVELKRRYNCDLQMGGSRSVGQHRQRRRTRPPHGELRTLRPDAAADHHVVRRQDGQDRARRRLAQRRHAESRTNTGNTGATAEDADVGRFLKIFTDLPLEEIARLEALQGAEINDAKKTLATEATALLHGRDEANKAEEAARATFEQGARSDNLPTFPSPAKNSAQGLRVTAAFVRAELVASNGEAKRHIARRRAAGERCRRRR